MITALALSRLLQLASPMLPVGAYGYSQGLEAAIETGLVHDPETAQDWITDVLDLYLARFELPLVWRMQACWRADDDPAPWNAMFCAGRGTAEGRAETLQMGASLLRLLADLDDFEPTLLARLKNIAPSSFPLAYAFAAAAWDIPADAAIQAYA
ncbi:MAG: urease accessory protein UreF, partial [Alphaproteobacteria bacterium]|nr:urease accessory protein UreF [Alphaproteobacteria bacterium]